MAKRTRFSDHSPRVSKRDYDQFNIDALLESFFSVSDSAIIDASCDGLFESRSTDSDQNDFIERAFHLGSLLIEASKRYVRKRACVHNASFWPLPHDLTVKVFSMLDTPSVCLAAATCTFFEKCAMDPLSYANIDLVTLVPKANDAVVSTMIKRAGNAFQSIKVGVQPPKSIRYLFNEIPRDDNQSGQENESSILTSSCLRALSANGGAPGSRLRRLHLYNIGRMDNIALLASLSVCPSLVDLEIVGLNVEFSHTLETVGRHCRLIERFIFEPSAPGTNDILKYSACEEFVLNCPKISTLKLKGCQLDDDNACILVQGFHELKYVDFTYCYSFTGAFLMNLGTKGGANNLEVMILQDSYDLKLSEVKRFMKALLAGEFRLLRHLDISNSEGLSVGCLDDSHRCSSLSSILIKQLLEQRPNLCFVAEFPINWCVDHWVNRMIDDAPNPKFDGSCGCDHDYYTSDSSYDSDLGNDSEDSHESSSVAYEESSDEVDDSDLGSDNEDNQESNSVAYEESSDEVDDFPF